MIYFYYWVPVKKHIDLFSSIRRQNVRRNIADIQKDKRVDLAVTIDENNLHLEIHLATDDASSRYRLVCRSYDDNGFVVYSLEQDTLTLLERDLFTIQVYHCFKEFFHEHEFHDEHTDALIKAKMSERLLDEKDFVEHYLQLYTNKFDAFKRLIAQHQPERVKHIYETTKDIKKAQWLLYKAKKWINKAKGEMIYADFLLSSALHYASTKQLYKEYRAHLDMYEKELALLYDAYDAVYAYIDLEYAKRINAYQIILGMMGMIFGAIGLLA